MKRTIVLFALVLLLAGCGGGPDTKVSEDGISRPRTTASTESSTSTSADNSSNEVSANKGETTVQTSGSAAGSDLDTVTIITSNGERVRVKVEVADTTIGRAIGLMYRKSLPQNQGMLFVYTEEDERSFYMKNTLIPLSVAFMDAEGRIMDIQDLKPLDETSHLSKAPAQYALEVNKGFFDERGVEVGDRAELPE